MIAIISLIERTVSMTKLLEQVIAQLKTIPADEQDAIAARLLAEMEDEQKWKAQFESTTDEQWDRIAEMVRQEIASGDIAPLADVFPSQHESSNQALQRHFVRNLMDCLHQFKNRLLKLINSGVQILTTIVFSSKELANPNQSIRLTSV